MPYAPGPLAPRTAGPLAPRLATPPQPLTQLPPRRQPMVPQVQRMPQMQYQSYADLLNAPIQNGARRQQSAYGASAYGPPRGYNPPELDKYGRPIQPEKPPPMGPPQRAPAQGKGPQPSTYVRDPFFMNPQR